MLVEYADDDARIGHTRDFDVAQVIGDAEALSKGGFERVHAGAARMDERSINVEKKEAPVRFCHVEWGRDISPMKSGALRGLATAECLP